ncbi:MAG: metallophosphoesterase [Kofleriaceae bacterium]|nr:metallophosphoesterase [Kofleriaceae bacterium]MBP9170377.1 metallophosphoesterase [Kofleriaceae bacterium]MBP9860061.1 metallophosphoesterase [Kofleriaceae bacterium]
MSARRLALIALFAVACDDPSSGATADAGVDGATPPYPPWAMVVLPDTQVYLDRYPAIWEAQTQWIAEQAEAQGIRLVVHVGDVTEWSTPTEWARAAAGFAEIEAVAPLVVVPGNHDYDVTRPRAGGLTGAWPVAALMARPSFGGLFEADRTDNHYQLLDVNGQRWLVLGLEWGPRPEVLDWANQVLDREPADHVIVVTHAYLYNDDRRYDWRRHGPAQAFNPHGYVGTAWPVVTDGEELWQTVLADRDHVDLVLSGHVAVDGIGRATSRTRTGHPVHEVLQDYQGEADGGAGDLRIFRFFGDRIEVETYSPWLDRPSPRADDRFALPWSP